MWAEFVVRRADTRAKTMHRWPNISDLFSVRPPSTLTSRPLFPAQNDTSGTRVTACGRIEDHPDPGSEYLLKMRFDNFLRFWLATLTLLTSIVLSMGGVIDDPRPMAYLFIAYLGALYAAAWGAANTRYHRGVDAVRTSSGR